MSNVEFVDEQWDDPRRFRFWDPEDLVSVLDPDDEDDDARDITRCLQGER